MSNYNLEVMNLSKAYPDFSLDNVSFSLPTGSIMGFVGKNGAGKTTIIKSILNIIQKDSGTVKLFGKEMTDKDTDIREDIGVVFDATNFSPDLNAKDLHNILSAIYRNWDKKKFFKLLNQLNIPTNKAIDTFSRGMIMKLSISVALSHNAKLLMLDEATAGLDPVVREEILDLFLEFIEDETHSIIMSSHLSSDLEKVADYITFIDKGKIVLAEEKDTLIYEYGIARMTDQEFMILDKKEYVAFRKRGLQIDVLLQNKDIFIKNHSKITVDNATIDEILLLITTEDL